MDQIPPDVLARIAAESGSIGNRSSDFMQDLIMGLGDMTMGRGQRFRPDSNLMRQRGMEQDYLDQMDAMFQAQLAGGQRHKLPPEQMLQLLQGLSPSNPITQDEMFPLVEGR